MCLIIVNISSCHFLCSRAPFSHWHLTCRQSTASSPNDEHMRLLEDMCCLLDWLDDFCRPLPTPCLKTACSVSSQVSACRSGPSTRRCRFSPFRAQNAVWFDFTLFYPLTGPDNRSGEGKGGGCVWVRVYACASRTALHRALAGDPLAADPLRGCPAME